ncbi:MAG TPA: outer membrane lipoprotein-sorting protein, partial [Bacteroidota bacterium]
MTFAFVGSPEIRHLLAFLWLASILSTAPLRAQSLSGDEILKRVDGNLFTESKIAVVRMVISGERGVRTLAAKSWQRGTRDAFTEFLAPPRDQGTKMLKLQDMLWTYSPSTDRTILISGHMLRQSMMGSDLSYEDMMEDPHLPNLYTAAIAGEDTAAGRRCWVLDLTARNEDVTYSTRKIWVDKSRYLPLKENLYA